MKKEHRTKPPKPRPIGRGERHIVRRDGKHKKLKMRAMSDVEIDIALEACGRVLHLGC